LTQLSQHSADAGGTALKFGWSPALRGTEWEDSSPIVQDTLPETELADEVWLMLKLGLLAIALISLGLGLLALG
jgi:hypothetical protein